MNNENTNGSNVVNALSRFRGKNSRMSDEQLEQDREHGKSALKNLKGRKKLSQSDREQIARRLGFHIQILNIDRSLLAKRSGFESKELYRLTLKQGEEAAQYRLRPTGNKYAALIETLSKLANPRADLFALSSRITRGTSAHPSGSMSNSEFTKIIDLVYSLADGIDEKFRLSEKFRTIAQMKESLDRSDPWAYWPSLPTPETIDSSQNHNPDAISKTSFWSSESLKKNRNGILEIEFENNNWEEIVGYLPNFFLGHQKNFIQDFEWWPAPENVKTNDQYNKWNEQVQNKMFSILENNPKIITSWDNKIEQLLFNKLPAREYLHRMYDFSSDTRLKNNPEMWEEEEEFRGKGIDTPSFYWLCIYPNTDATGVVPVLLSTDIYHHDCSIELLDEVLLEDIAKYPLLGGGTLGSRLEEAFLVEHDKQVPQLKAEWIRTAPFIERHPLHRKYMKYLATERHIKKWRKENLEDLSSDE